MKKKLLTAILISIIISMGVVSAQNKSFSASLETTDGVLKSKIEESLVSLVSAFNRAGETGSDMLDLTGANVSEETEKSLAMLWKNIHFCCPVNSFKEILSSTVDNNYQVRNIPIKLLPEPGVDAGDRYREAVVDFDCNGRILSFYFGLDNNLYRNIVMDNSVEDLRFRQTILDYVEHFRMAYEQKDLDFLEQVFSEDVLIITGKVIRTRKSDSIFLDQEDVSIKYNTYGKSDYLRRLKEIFNTAKYIKVKFTDVKVSRHPTKKGFYGVLVKQGYDSGYYSDEGYVFMLWDFTDENKPQIHVRTWQPYWIDDTKSVKLPEDRIINLVDFEI